MVRNLGYPDVELGELEFERLLALVDALDTVQLLRLQCKVSSLMGDPPTVVGGRDADTLPPPPLDEWPDYEDTWPGGRKPGV